MKISILPKDIFTHMFGKVIWIFFYSTQIYSPIVDLQLTTKVLCPFCSPACDYFVGVWTWFWAYHCDYASWLDQVSVHAYYPSNVVFLNISHISFLSYTACPQFFFLLYGTKVLPQVCPTCEYLLVFAQSISPGVDSAKIDPSCWVAVGIKHSLSSNNTFFTCWEVFLRFFKLFNQDFAINFPLYLQAIVTGSCRKRTIKCLPKLGN